MKGRYLKHWLLTTSLLLPGLFATQFSHAQGNAWELVRNDAGITIHQRALPGKTYKETNGRMLVDVQMDALLSVLKDPAACPRWLNGCRSSKVVKDIRPGERINYTVMDAPFLLDDRDMYIRSKVTYDSQTKTALVTLTGLENYAAPEAKRVRVRGLRGFWRFQQIGDQQTQVEYQNYNDPQVAQVGAVNAGSVKGVFKTMLGLKKLASSPQYRNQRFDNATLTAVTIR